MAALAVFLAPPAAAVRPPEACAAIEARGVSYVVCRFDPATEDIRLFLNGSDGEPYRHFSRLEAALARDGVKLRFAMNAGMYRPNRAPVGLYVEEGATRAAVNRRDCSGNFCLKPNGVFWIGEDGAAHVTETAAFIAAAPAARYATQSGPMLVVGGDIHPKFLKDSPSRHRRNGVGVTASGAVVFAISDAPVTFHAFASLFRDELRTPDALYLDGAISRLYASELGRHDDGAAMGPIVAVVASSQ